MFLNVRGLVKFELYLSLSAPLKCSLSSDWNSYKFVYRKMLVGIFVNDVNIPTFLHGNFWEKQWYKIFILIKKYSYIKI
jgi:hypothetical protein